MAIGKKTDELKFEIISPTPKVELLRYFEKPCDFSVSAARTCYSPKVIKPEEVTPDQKERIGQGCFEGGHHTVFQHATFSFCIENVSRHFVWAFLHSHPFYNSDQSSQRYVKLNELKVSTPPIIENEQVEIFKKAVLRAWETYTKLTEILLNDLVGAMGGAKVVDEKEKKKLEKKAIEIARYVLPIAAHTSLVHTISGLTLYRLWKLSNQLPTSWEQKVVVEKMVEEVKKVAPDFFELIKDPVPLEETLEYKFMKGFAGCGMRDADSFIKEFDSELGKNNSKLVSYLKDGEKLMADSVRTTTGLTKKEISDEDAIDFVLNPQKNSYLLETLNVATISPLMRSMNMPYFVFKKKLSHSADSQEQRHRTNPASRPVLSFADTKEPDYITPFQIERNKEAKKIYDEFMAEIWNYKNKLIENKVPVEFAQYILPNALTVRIVESTNFLNWFHKLRLRLCLCSQREIWELCLEELEQVRKIFPNLCKYIGPDCRIRVKASAKPFCLQGPLTCGEPVWAWEKLEKGKRLN